MNHIKALDGLRAVAVVMVLCVHCFDAAPGGVLGVDVFFVLSGYLITRLFIAERERTGSIDLFNFYVRRFLRLMPCLAAVVCLSLAAAAILNSPRVFRENVIDGLMAIAYVSNWWQIAIHERRNLFSHAWSLSIEEQFYVLWGIGAYLLLRKTTVRTTLITLLAALAVVYLWRVTLYESDAYVWWLMHGFDTRADELIAGCALAVFVSMPVPRGVVERWYARHVNAGLLALAALLFLIPFVRVPSPFYLLLVIPTVIILAAIIILDVSLREGSPLSRLLSWPPLVYIGVISYGIYLWHFPLLGFIRSTPLDTAAARAALAFGLTPIIATVSYWQFERKIMQLKHRLRTRAASRSVQQRAPARRPAG